MRTLSASLSTRHFKRGEQESEEDEDEDDDASESRHKEVRWQPRRRGGG